MSSEFGLLATWPTALRRIWFCLLLVQSVLLSQTTSLPFSTTNIATIPCLLQHHSSRSTALLAHFATQQNRCSRAVRCRWNSSRRILPTTFIQQRQWPFSFSIVTPSSSTQLQALGGWESLVGAADWDLLVNKVMSVQQTLQQSIYDVTSAAAASVTTPSSPLGPDPKLLEEAESAALSGLGRDVLIFLAASVAVVPISLSLGITPVLGFLIAGALLGPHALAVFSNSEADLVLGDIGILFLLFSEGLNLSPKKIEQLGSFYGLGVLQMLASMALLFTGLLVFGPVLLQYSSMPFIPDIDDNVRQIFTSPVTAFCIASAGALSSSAFVLPVLKERGWEDRPEGVAALSVLLLQDLAVAPLLVLLPLVAGSGPQSAQELGILAAKATVGFGAVLAVGSVLLRYVFDIVAAARSTETFVAAALTVALGMGQAADYLGLSATTGAFAAGVLLAGNRYRAQIKADVRPFEGILLGIFFLTAGASLDPVIIIQNWTTLLIGMLVFILVKAAVLFVAGGPALGKSKAQAARVAITLSGGGEFSLVLFQLAHDLQVLPDELFALLSASVVISMSLTPLLGAIADSAGNYLERWEGKNVALNAGLLSPSEAAQLFDVIDADSSGTIDFEELRQALMQRGLTYASIAEVYEAFDTNNDGTISREEWIDGLKSGLLAAALRVGTAASQASAAPRSIASNAVVLCGFTEFGRELYYVLEAAGYTEDGNVVAFDLNPTRVDAAVDAGANVVYGDGASWGVLRATGVRAPKAVIVAYRAEKSRLDATLRLRAALPVDTPIFVRVVSGQSLGHEELVEAGATDTVSERTEAAIRFAALLGSIEQGEASEEAVEVNGGEYVTSSSGSLLSVAQAIMGQREASVNQLLQNVTATVPNNKSADKVSRLGIPDDRVNDLADEFECSRRDLERLYDIFSSLPSIGDDKYASVADLRDLLLRTDDFPLPDNEVAGWVNWADADRNGSLSFVDFARAYFGARQSRPSSIAEVGGVPSSRIADLEVL